jgi:hypothetical protein
MRVTARLLTLATILASLSSVASGYLPLDLLRQPGRSIYAIPARFDLAALPNKTVSFFVSDQLPSVLVPNDNFDALLSQIRRAAATWNSVGTSDLRLRFGGISTVVCSAGGARNRRSFRRRYAAGLFAQTSVSNNRPGVSGDSRPCPDLPADRALPSAVTQRPDHLSTGQLLGHVFHDHCARVRTYSGVAAFPDLGHDVDLDDARHH